MPQPCDIARAGATCADSQGQDKAAGADECGRKPGPLGKGHPEGEGEPLRAWGQGWGVRPES